MASGVAKPFLMVGHSIFTEFYLEACWFIRAFIKSCCLQEKCIALATNSSKTNVMRCIAN